jgi:hypothetical protein
MKLWISVLLLTCGISHAGPVIEMNKAFRALSDLIPFITDKKAFEEKKNEAQIQKDMSELQVAFKSAKHDMLLKEDLFAPSYALINEHIAGSVEAFKQGKKDYAHWRMREITTLCLDCHTRLPANVSSSFQNGEAVIDRTKFENIYNLGIAQLIVRQYVEAKESFLRSIDERIIKQEPKDIILPFKQLLLIDSKIQRNPTNLLAVVKTYEEKKNLPEEVKSSLAAWKPRLQYWQKQKVLESGLDSEKAVKTFIANHLLPLKKKTLSPGNEVDLLIASGLLSNYLFLNHNSKLGPEITYWIGWSEKYLKRDNFFGSGDLFLKQCMVRHPKAAIAKECLKEYKESVEFEFSGSAGTDIPEDVQKELKHFEKTISK